VDLTKYLLGKFFGFLAGVVPGFVALLVFQLAEPGSFGWFFSGGFLTYEAKVGVILIVAFLIGNCMTTFLMVLKGEVEDFVAKEKKQGPQQLPPIDQGVPWRDIRWRLALKNRLGKKAPENVRVLPAGFLDEEQKRVAALPEAERRQSLGQLEETGINVAKDDADWYALYCIYHAVVLERSEQDDALNVREGLDFNLETAALVVLISALFVPSLRHWWCILPACMWIVIFVLEERADARRYNDLWSTLDDQILYFAEDDATADDSAKADKD
jgi:hypothetical protein